MFISVIWRGGEEEGNYLTVLHNAALPSLWWAYAARRVCSLPSRTPASSCHSLPGHAAVGEPAGADATGWSFLPDHLTRSGSVHTICKVPENKWLVCWLQDYTNLKCHYKSSTKKNCLYLDIKIQCILWNLGGFFSPSVIEDLGRLLPMHIMPILLFNTQLTYFWGSAYMWNEWLWILSTWESNV